MKTNYLNMHTFRQSIPATPIVQKQSSIICQEHGTSLVEVWQGNIKVNEYCPVCYREQMKEGSE